MLIHFTKMHGAGNDFVVIDAINQPLALNTEQLRFIANRQFGIGCDQILLVEKPTQTAADFRYRIFNADGGEVEQCGNGARCFARFVFEQGLTNKKQICVETLSGLITPRLEDDGRVTVNMGAPIFTPTDIPFIGAGDVVEKLSVGNQTVDISTVSMGNPHAVLVVEDVDNAPVTLLGAAIECHPQFPKRVNVGFMQRINTQQIKLRVFERGAGETLSCGTGACAAAVSAIRRGLVSSPVNVATRGGMLTIAWDGPQQAVMMTGPVCTVFQGKIELE